MDQSAIAGSFDVGDIPGLWRAGYSQTRIAKLLGCSVNAVAGQVRRQRQRGVNMPARDVPENLVHIEKSGRNRIGDRASENSGALRESHTHASY